MDDIEKGLKLTYSCVDAVRAIDGRLELTCVLASGFDSGAGLTCTFINGVDAIDGG